MSYLGTMSRKHKFIKFISIIILLAIVILNCSNKIEVITFRKTFGGTGYDYGCAVLETDDGYIITGKTSSFGSVTSDVYLIKTNKRGVQNWAKTYGDSSNDVGNSVVQTSDRGYVIVGCKESSVYIIRTNEEGDTIWTKTYGEYTQGNDIKQTTDGGFIIVGKISLPATRYDVYLIKTDTNGDSLWTKTFGGTYWDYGNSVQQTSDDGYIIGGTTASFGAGRSDVYLIKTDENGNTE